MERRADGQRDASAAQLLDLRGEVRHTAFQAGNDRLAGAVEVDGIELLKFRGSIRNGLCVQLDDRAHGGLRCIGSLLHQLPAGADDSEAVRIGIGTCKCQCRDLAEREARRCIRMDAVFLECTRRRQIDQIQAGLRIRGLFQFLVRAGKGLLHRARADRLRRVVKCLCSRARLIQRFAHAAVLRALSGKKKCDLSH